MRFSSVVIAAALACAALFLLGISYQWPRALFHCEGFGCSAMGVVYLIYAAIIVIMFAICGALFGSRPRSSSALFAGGTATLAHCLAFGVLFVRNQMQIARDMEAHEATCARYPKLCPEKTMPAQTSSQNAR